MVPATDAKEAFKAIRTLMRDRFPQQPRCGTRVSDRPVRVVEHDAVLLARLAELATRGAKRVERKAPIDVDPRGPQLVADHPHIEPDVVTCDDGSVEPRRDVLRHIGERGRRVHHAGLDAVTG
jgi:hypothetical protein